MGRRLDSASQPLRAHKERLMTKLAGIERKGTRLEPKDNLPASGIALVKPVARMRCVRVKTQKEMSGLCGSLCLSGWVGVFSEDGGWLAFFV